MINTAIRSAWGAAIRSFVKAVKVTLQTARAAYKAKKYSLKISDSLFEQRRNYNKMEHETFNDFYDKMR